MGKTAVGKFREVVDFANEDPNMAIDAGDAVTYVEITSYDDGTQDIQRKTVTVDTYLNVTIEEANRDYTAKQRLGSKEARGQAILRPLALAQVDIDRVATRIYGEEFTFTGVKASDDDGPSDAEVVTEEDYGRHLLRARFLAEAGDPSAISAIDDLAKLGRKAGLLGGDVQEDIQHLYEILAGPSGKRTLEPGGISFLSSVTELLGLSQGLSKDDMELSNAGLFFLGVIASFHQAQGAEA
ncbi:MAG TPA: hypothetical protein VFX30_05475 [bacterium]|nr:hypothetical protein [bacterium]